MRIELTCLGGAAAWPNPGQGCSSYLVRAGGATVLLDAGPNTLLELRKHVAFETLDAVIISHCHSDHILDLIPYRYGLVYSPVEPTRPIPVWLPPGGTKVLQNLAGALSGQGEQTDDFWDSVFALREYDSDEGLTIGDLTVTFARTVHPAVCYAMRLQAADGSSLTYTADTGVIESVLDLARGSNILISEATMPEDAEKPGRESGHLKPSEAGALARDAHVGTLVLAHLWAERPDADVVESARASFSGDIVIAKPGLVVNG